MPFLLKPNKKCYSSSNGLRYATSRSHDKRYGSQKRCSITSYSKKWYFLKFYTGCNRYTT
ncbi:hypothetical protein Pint_05032 [Pistacia integerrima]|uniref:Uncharacterized protein n=1 Tax=Pistacia integerrima TaxID=434235 RepID=A0ACC0Z6Y4_9ROSI|nr:hypothetical protein Pint_05032 [Pistacia integerrima]